MLQISRTDGRLCLRVLVLALLATLLLAAAAQADVPAGGGEAPGGAPEGQEVGGPEAPQGAGGEGEVAPEAPGGEPPVETQQVVPSEPVAEAPPPPSEPVAETPPPPSEPVAEAPAPPSEPVEGLPTGTLPVEGTPPAGETAEEPGQGKAGESSEEATGGSPHSATLLPAAPDSSAHVEALAGEASSGPPGPPPTAAVTAQVAEVTGQAEMWFSEASKRAGQSAGTQAGRFSCELSALGGNMTDNCTVGWLGAPRELASAPASAAVAAVSSLAGGAAVNSPDNDGRGGSAVGGPPLTPAPGPAPSGGSGVATGAGGSGGAAGVSTFLTLAGLLLLGPPRALRRLRFSCEPWLAGCFVLIPERPD